MKAVLAYSVVLVVLLFANVQNVFTLECYECVYVEIEGQSSESGSDCKVRKCG